jgi:hypothetical protein
MWITEWLDGGTIITQNCRIGSREGPGMVEPKQISTHLTPLTE